MKLQNLLDINDQNDVLQTTYGGERVLYYNPIERHWTTIFDICDTQATALLGDVDNPISFGANTQLTLEISSDAGIDDDRFIFLWEITAGYGVTFSNGLTSIEGHYQQVIYTNGDPSGSIEITISTACPLQIADEILTLEWYSSFVFVSGSNSAGQLGLGSTLYNSSTMTVNPSLIPIHYVGEIAEMAAGSNVSIIIKPDGTMWGTGQYLSGTLGVGDTTQRPYFIQVAEGVGGWKSVSSNTHTMAIKEDGTLWGTGENTTGGLGIQTNIDTVYFEQESLLDTDWVQVSCGLEFTLARKADGTIWSCGNGGSNRTGLGSTLSVNIFTQIGTDADWAHISAGGLHSFGIKNDGTLWGWGENFYGQLGLDPITDMPIPTKIGTDTDWVKVECGYEITLATKTNGTLWGTGRNADGGLGVGDILERRSFTQEDSLATDWDPQKLFVGLRTSAAIKIDGTLWMSGTATGGLIPLTYDFDPTIDVISFTKITTLGGWKKAAMSTHLIAIHEKKSALQNTIMVSGQNPSGCWGTGSLPLITYHFTHLNAYSTDIALAGKTITNPSFFKKADGSIISAGYNVYGGMGVGSTISSTTFQDVPITNVKDIVGHTNSLMVMTDGTLWSCGRNNYGQCGVGDVTQNLFFTKVGLDNDWDSVYNAGYSSFALKTNGLLFGCGYNNSYELGLGFIGQINSFTETVGSIQFKQISAQGFCAGIDFFGRLYSWGVNSYYQLGFPTLNETVPVPTQVGTDSDWVKVGRGYQRIFALKRDGTIWCAGNNYDGLLGLGWKTLTAGEPFQLMNTDTDWADISISYGHAIFTKTDGSVWGIGPGEMLGIGASTDIIAPIRIYHLDGKSQDIRASTLCTTVLL